MSVRNVTRVVTSHRQREGAGFIVRRPFPGAELPLVDPFLLLDEMGPIDQAPGTAVGAPDHPHRGFETVTYLLEGEAEHEDSAGHRGTLRAGDVQWMTAGRGVVHSEMPSRRLQREGGRMHGFQLWVNLPRKDKWIAPRYQEIASASLPVRTTDDGLATVKVIAGEALGARAVIETRTEIAYHHWSLRAGAKVMVPLAPRLDVCVYVFSGEAQIAGRSVREGQLAILGAGESIELLAASGAELLVLGGVPLREPIARYGPFVMNTEEEILEAFADFEAGRMGQITR